MSTVQQMLEKLHHAVAEDLLLKVKGGEATAGELMAAIRFLKDNNIDALPSDNSNIKALVDSLPFAIEKSDLMQH